MLAYILRRLLLMIPTILGIMAVSFAIVQYVPCVARPDGEEARQTAKSAIGLMLPSFWPAEGDWPPAKEKIVAESGIRRRDFVAALNRLRRRETTS